jgi:hypothetical protein
MEDELDFIYSRVLEITIKGTYLMALTEKYSVIVIMLLNQNGKGFVDKNYSRGQLYGAQGLCMMKLRHFIFCQFGVPTDGIFWYTCHIFWHTCLISNFRILKICQFCKTKSKKCQLKKWIAIQTLANIDFVWQNVMLRQTKLQKLISHTKGCNP